MYAPRSSGLRSPTVHHVYSVRELVANLRIRTAANGYASVAASYVRRSIGRKD
jgi:hypothetical protein